MKQNWKRTLQGALLGAALLRMKWVKAQKICLMMGIQLIFMDLLQTIW